MIRRPPLSDEAMLRRLKHLPNTITCGIHSGFPPCCIHFYITKKLWMTEEENIEYMKKCFEADLNSLGKPSQYIRCFSCIEKNNFIEVKPCPNGYCDHSEECAE